MFRKIRRKKQELTEKQCLDILRRAKTATLALSGDDGYPYSVPMNFVYEDGKIYFHGAKEGHKIDAIKNNPKVSMSIIDQEVSFFLGKQESYKKMMKSIMQLKH